MTRNHFPPHYAENISEQVRRPCIVVGDCMSVCGWVVVVRYPVGDDGGRAPPNRLVHNQSTPNQPPPQNLPAELIGQFSTVEYELQTPPAGARYNIFWGGWRGLHAHIRMVWPC